MKYSKTQLFNQLTGFFTSAIVALAPNLTQADTPGKFDFYLLSLSWSPTFCLSKGKSAPKDQCGSKKYGFVVHGLWPQNENGWPANCDAQPENVPPKIAEEVYPIMPSKKLIEHEWDKHGKCSGLDAAGYFNQVETIFAGITFPEALKSPEEAIRISPEKIKQSFVDANPNAGFTKDSIAVTCNGKTLSEVRLCLDKSLKAQSCSAGVLKQQCRQKTVLVPPLR